MNKYWEELDMPFDITKFLKNKVGSDMRLPDWMSINCTHCGEDLSKGCVRSFGLRTNAKNYGDIFVEIACEYCNSLLYVYFNEKLKSVDDFIPYIKGEKDPSTNPIEEDEMHKKNYNNIVEIMINEQQET